MIIKTISFTVLFCLVACKTSSQGPRKPTESEQQQSANPPVADQPAQVATLQKGVIDGNGGELISWERNPWFVGDEPAIKYCLKKADDFSAPIGEVRKEIQAALAFWKKFFVATAGYKTTTNLNEVIRNEVFFSFIYTDEERNLYPEFPKKRLILDFQEVPCEGNPPLVFKLGVTDEEAATVLRYTAETTLAFAYHAQYDPIAEESRGFVWLAADQGLKKYRGPQEQDRFWQEPASLYNILVHELGHVFGVQHIPKTLMDESFPVNAIAKGMKIRASGFEMMLNNITALTDKICGKAMAEEAVGEIWKLQQMAGRKICVQMRHDLLAVGEHDTPVLLQIFQDDGKVAIEQYLSTDGVYEGADYSIAGKFLVKNSSGQLDFFKANLTYFFSNEIYRGQFQALEQHYPLELEIIHPGAIVIRIFSGSRWLSLAFVPDGHEEEFSQLLGLYNLEQ